MFSVPSEPATSLERNRPEFICDLSQSDFALREPRALCRSAHTGKHSCCTLAKVLLNIDLFPDKAPVSSHGCLRAKRSDNP